MPTLHPELGACSDKKGKNILDSTPENTMENPMNNNIIILLVDDNPTNLQVLYQTLQGMQYKILIAKNGRDALKIAEKSQPAIILLDIMMPGIDGFEVLKRLKANDKTRASAVIFLSALDETKNKVKGLEMGAVDYIAKPFHSSEVIARVKTHLRIRELEQVLAEKNRQLQQSNTLILQSMREGLIELDAKGNILDMNPAALQMLGWHKDEIINANFHSHIQHSDSQGNKLPPESSPVLRALRESNYYQSDGEYFWHKNNQCFAVEYSLTPLAQGAFLLFKDISARKQAEQELKQALEEVSALKERLQQENIYLQNELKSERDFDDIIGDSKALNKVLDQVRQVAETDSTVLIYGESGTGKEAIAHAIHQLSPRKDKALIKVNCGAISQSLVESELFGHVKGAFTSAISDHRGYFELADGGSIFLDEIGELSLDIQVKLLRVLQEQEIQPVGSSKVITVDVRIIAATNKDLSELVQQKLFRMDLFYRLNVFPITIPPLRQRMEDLPLLIDHFIKVFSAKLNKRLSGISDKSLKLLQSYAWPGNIRELQNVIERSAILSRSGKLEVDASLLSSEYAPDFSDSHGAAARQENYQPMTLAENERQFIIRTLQQVDWVVGGKKGAAEILGLPVSTLRSKMKKLGISQ